ncbi:MAG TPA: hypothetical protein VL993_04555 [Stellaceae bacterium]|nr:hypothetical protein [Stellaceae bacterium]
MIFVACAAILYFQYSDSVSLAEASASRVFAEAAVRADGQVNELLDRAIVLARVAPNIRGIGDPIHGDGQDQPALDFLTAAVNSGPSIYAAYYGLEDGSFLEIIATRGDLGVMKMLAAPAGTARVLRAVIVGSDQSRTQNWTYLDANGAVLSRRSDGLTTFDPRETDWYRRAKSEAGTAMTEPYRFSSIPELGLSVVQSLPEKRGVFGIDVTLSELSLFLNEHPISPNGGVYIFDDSLRLLAAPADGPNGVPTDKLVSDMRSLGSPVLQMLADLSGTSNFGKARFLRLQSRDYGAFVSLWSGTGDTKVNIGVAAPLDDFTGGNELFLLRTLLATAAILVAALLLVVWFARQSHLLRASERRLRVRTAELEALHGHAPAQRAGEQHR